MNVRPSVNIVNYDKSNFPLIFGTSVLVLALFLQFYRVPNAFELHERFRYDICRCQLEKSLLSLEGKECHGR